MDLNSLRFRLIFGTILELTMMKQWILILSLLTVTAQAQTFDGIKPYLQKSEWDKAIEQLQKMDATKLSPDNQALKAFLTGYALFQKKQWDQAEASFKVAAELSKKWRVYSHYHLALIAKQKNDLAKNAKELNNVLNSEPPKEMTYSIRYELADLAVQNKKWNEAANNLNFLEKKWRRSSHYPDVVYDLLKMEVARGRSSQACKWARKLYAEHPEYDAIKDWSIDFRSVKVDGKPLSCLVSSKDQSRRVRRLQWAGRSDRARQEIESLRPKSGNTNNYSVDAMLANFLVSEGLTEEALKILLNHYRTQKNNFNYLTLLARAAARAGEFQTAVGAYYKAHQLSPGSRSGREALFQAAFLSYQFQDYDGATRKFEKFISKYAKSGLAKDARWHLAWIKYLKGNYQGALADFQNSKWRSRKLSNEKLKYWTAMSLMKLDRNKEAKVIFEALAKDRGFGFYSWAAKFRLKELPADLPVVQAPPPKFKAPGPLLAVDPDQQDAMILTLTEESLTPTNATETASEESESEENLKINQEVSDEDTSDEESDVPVVDDEKIVVSDIKDPNLAKRIDRANDLIGLGFLEWARWELLDVESRTRNSSYLRSLMGAYENIQAYNRSSYIGETTFGRSRYNQGLHGAKDLWQFTYPLAFKEHVQNYSKKYGIPEALAWAIMRAESQYNPNVISPVGARGLMQLMPFTARQVGKLVGENVTDDAQLLDPGLNIRLGTRYLSRLSQKFEDFVPLVAAGYNAGPHRVWAWLKGFGNLQMDEFIEHIPFPETRDYAKKVVRNYAIYKSLYESPTSAEKSLQWLVKPLNMKVPERAIARESWESI